jgi:hypothetical protein
MLTHMLLEKERGRESDMDKNIRERGRNERKK